MTFDTEGYGETKKTLDYMFDSEKLRETYNHPSWCLHVLPLFYVISKRRLVKFEHVSLFKPVGTKYLKKEFEGQRRKAAIEQ